MNSGCLFDASVISWSGMCLLWTQEALSSAGAVKYIDVTDCSTEAHVRCADAASAAAVAGCDLPGCTLRVLARPAEQAYWAKAESDRLQKLTNKNTTKRRGRDKVCCSRQWTFLIHFIVYITIAPKSQ